MVVGDDKGADDGENDEAPRRDEDYLRTPSWLLRYLGQSHLNHSCINNCIYQEVSD